MTSDERFMRLALRLARRGLGRTSPNPCVGAVIVRGGEVVGRGYHERAGSPHAEIEAIRDAGEGCRGATMYVNLEPCCTHGRTPPCVPEIRAAGIGRVVAAMRDPNPAVRGRGFRALRRSGIEVSVGVLEQEAARLNEAFAKHVTNQMPFVLLKWAMTLDGKIASRTGESRWISSPEARTHVHRLRSEYEAVMVGVGTVAADDPSLTPYLIGGRRRHDPVRVIVDSRGRTPPGARAIAGSEAPCVVATTRRAPESRLARLREAGAEILVCKRDRDGRVALRDLMAKLGAREIMSVMIEGGGELPASALAAGVVDKLLFIIAPKVLGGKDAKTPVEGRGIARVADALGMQLTRVRRVGVDLIVEAYVIL
jgi:diaminohydroxyphosphoribosylaminopyrimidine deaminase/5-amino-6-(5-phosphoribosylamino)uracil reductase